MSIYVLVAAVIVGGILIGLALTMSLLKVASHADELADADIVRHGRPLSHGVRIRDGRP